MNNHVASYDHLIENWCRNNLKRGHPPKGEEFTVQKIKQIVERIYNVPIGSIKTFEVLKRIYGDSMSHQELNADDPHSQRIVYVRGYTMDGSLPFRRIRETYEIHEKCEERPEDERMVELIFMYNLTRKTIFNDYDIRTQFNITRPNGKAFQVDFAIFSEGKLFAIVECKKKGDNRNGFGQLYEYMDLLFNQNLTPIGIWTNGEQYARLSLTRRGFELEYMTFEEIFNDKLKDRNLCVLEPYVPNFKIQTIEPQGNKSIPIIKTFLEGSKEDDEIWDRSMNDIIIYQKHLHSYERKECLVRDICQNPKATILGLRFFDEDIIERDKLLSEFHQGRMLIYNRDGNAWIPREIWIHHIGKE
jgi:hypothetical protein